MPGSSEGGRSERLTHAFILGCTLNGTSTSTLHSTFYVPLQNLAAWAVAGGISYYLWIKPERDAAAARQVR